MALIRKLCEAIKKNEILKVTKLLRKMGSAAGCHMETLELMLDDPCVDIDVEGYRITRGMGLEDMVGHNSYSCTAIAKSE